MAKAAAKPGKKPGGKPGGVYRDAVKATRKGSADAVRPPKAERGKVIHVAHSSTAGRIVRVRKPLEEEDYGLSEGQLKRAMQILHDQAEQDAKEGRVVRYKGRGHLAKLLGGLSSPPRFSAPPGRTAIGRPR